jgi:hypothetical protein
MIFAFYIVHGKAIGESLHVMRHGGSVDRMGLPRLRGGFGAGDVFRAGQREQVAAIRRVQKISAGHGQPRTVVHMLQGDGPHPVAVRFGGHRPDSLDDGDGSAVHVRSEHRFQYSQRGAGLVADAAYNGVAGIEQRLEGG